MSNFLDAIVVTSSFEGKDLWGNVSKPFNFDGQTLSCGAVQFTYASGNMQRVIKLALLKNGFWQMVEECAPKFGQEYINAMVYFTDEAAKKSISDLKYNQDFFRKELRALWSSDIMIEAQKEALLPVDKETQKLVKTFEKETKLKTTKKAYFFFFDLLIQNGGLKDVWPWEKQPFANDCFDFMAKQENGDTKKNLVLWERSYERATEEGKTLFLIGWSRALVCRKEYITDVLNRKGTIALGTGWVHQEKYFIDKLASLP